MKKTSVQHDPAVAALIAKLKAHAGYRSLGGATTFSLHPITPARLRALQKAAAKLVKETRERGSIPMIEAMAILMGWTS